MPDFGIGTEVRGNHGHIDKKATGKMHRSRSTVFVLITLLSLGGNCQAAITFDDGSMHDLDVEVDDVVQIRNSTDVELTGTVANTCDDCPLFSELVRVEDQSSLKLNGGRVISGTQGRNITHGIVMLDDSRFLSLSGAVTSDAHGSVASLRMRHNSSALLINGQFVSHGTGWDTSGVWLSENASARMFGGSVSGRSKDVGNGLFLQGNSSFTLHGGRVETASETIGMLASLADYASLEIRGGSFFMDRTVGDHYLMRASGNSRFEMSDGVIQSEDPSRLEWILQLSDSSTAVITGGRIIDDHGRFLRATVGIDAHDQSMVFMSGGNIEHRNTGLVDKQTEIMASGNSEIILAGMNFNFPMNEPLMNTRGTVIGNWMSGEAIEFDFAVEDNATLTFVEGVLGDYTGDLELNVSDLDILNNAIHLSSTGRQFDLNADDRIDEQDRAYWVSELGNTYIGDANLDGEFGSADFVQVFQAGEYEDIEMLNSTWATGDWDGDFEFASSDIVLAFQFGGYGRGPRLADTLVPEPSPWLIPLLFWLVANRKTMRSAA